MRYLVNAFSLDMLSLGPGERRFRLVVRELSVEEFCREIDYNSLPVPDIPACRVGHESTLRLINDLCGLQYRMGYNCSRSDVYISSYPVELIIIQIAFRLKEGEVVDAETLKHMVRTKNIRFLKVVVDSS